MWQLHDILHDHETRSQARSDEVGLIGAIASWCEFLHNKAQSIETLRRIAEALDAEAVALSRVLRYSGGDRNIIAYDSMTNRHRALALERSFARAVLGSYVEKPKSGSIWLKSMLEDEVDPVLTEFHKKRGLAELVVVSLEVSEKAVDFVEIHFAHKLRFDDHAVLNLAAQTLARTWRNRSQGIFTELLLKRRERHAAMPVELPILSSENPARLSRAEYRVCLMLSHGKTIENTTKELGISMATIRTHLKNIYAKTETSCHSELLYQLLTFRSLAAHDYGQQRIG